MVTTRVVPSPVLTDEGTWKQGQGRHPVRVAVRLDRDRVFEVLFQRLDGPPSPPDPPQTDNHQSKPKAGFRDCTWPSMPCTALSRPSSVYGWFSVIPVKRLSQFAPPTP
jgi:hypothetical protein